MRRVTISAKYQVVIPKEIREKLKLKPGQIMQAFQFGGRLEFVVLKNIKDFRGSLKGISTDIEKEGDRL